MRAIAQPLGFSPQKCRKPEALRFPPLLLASASFALAIWLMVDLALNQSTLVKFLLRVAAGVIFVYCIIRGLQEERLLNPWLLFSVTPFSLLIYNRNVSTYFLLDLSYSTWVLALLNMAAFLLGLYLFAAKGRGGSPASLLRADESPEDCTFHALALLCLSQIGAVISFLNSTFSLLIYPAIAYALKSRKKWLIVVVVGFVLLGFTESFNKSMALSFGLVLLVFYESRGKQSKGRTALLVLVLVALIVFLGFPLKAFMEDGASAFEAVQDEGIIAFLLDSYEGEVAWYSSRIHWAGPDFLMMPYMYLTTAWTNLQYVVETQAGHTWGLWTLRPILAYLQLDEVLESFYDLNLYRSTFNTWGFITVQYRDFGYFGSVLVSLGLGCFVRWVYNLSLQGLSPLMTGCWALVAQATAEMFFSNHFFQQSYPFTILILCAAYGWGMGVLLREKRPAVYQSS